VLQLLPILKKGHSHLTQSNPWMDPIYAQLWYVSRTRLPRSCILPDTIRVLLAVI